MAKDEKPIPPANTQPEPPTQYLRPKRYEDKGKIADGGPEGYQADRVGKKLDRLERDGVVLDDHTPMELRRLLELRFEDDRKKLGLPPPSRQVMDTVIKHRLS